MHQKEWRNKQEAIDMTISLICHLAATGGSKTCWLLKLAERNLQTAANKKLFFFFRKITSMQTQQDFNNMVIAERFSRWNTNRWASNMCSSSKQYVERNHHFCNINLLNYKIRDGTNKELSMTQRKNLSCRRPTIKSCWNQTSIAVAAQTTWAEKPLDIRMCASE